VSSGHEEAIAEPAAPSGCRHLKRRGRGMQDVGKCWFLDGAGNRARSHTRLHFAPAARLHFVTDSSEKQRRAPGVFPHPYTRACARVSGDRRSDLDQPSRRNMRLCRGSCSGSEQLAFSHCARATNMSSTDSKFEFVGASRQQERHEAADDLWQQK
jgi:hypothetical protein